MLVIETPLRSPAGEALTARLLAIATTEVLLVSGFFSLGTISTLHFSPFAFSTCVRCGNSFGGAATMSFGVLARL